MHWLGCECNVLCFVCLGGTVVEVKGDEMTRLEIDM